MALGKHWLIELHGCDRVRISVPGGVREAMLAAARACRATVVAEVFHQFSPYGVSGVVVIAESHLAIHTWPEHGFVAVDLFTCGESLDAESGIELLRESFGAQRIEVMTADRGVGVRLLGDQIPPAVISPHAG